MVNGNGHSPPSQQQRHQGNLLLLLGPELLDHKVPEPQLQQLAEKKYFVKITLNQDVHYLLVSGHLLLVQGGIILRGWIHC